jgi:hypothetical protein
MIETNPIPANHLYRQSLVARAADINARVNVGRGVWMCHLCDGATVRPVRVRSATVVGWMIIIETAFGNEFAPNNYREVQAPRDGGSLDYERARIERLIATDGDFAVGSEDS